MEAIALLQEWVQVIGSKAGLNFANSSIHSGAVGVPESRLEVNIRSVTCTSSVSMMDYFVHNQIGSFAAA